MASDLDELYEANPLNNRIIVRSRRSSAVTRQYPPPMTRNPWVLKRECFDGRLTLKAQRAKRSQHFRVHRENGRLVIALVASETEERKLEVDEEGEEGTGVTCDELENGIGPFSFSYDGYVNMGLKVPIGSWVVRDSPPPRPITTAMKVLNFPVLFIAIEKTENYVATAGGVGTKKHKTNFQNTM